MSAELAQIGERLQVVPTVISNIKPVLHTLARLCRRSTHSAIASESSRRLASYDAVPNSASLACCG